jgi:hypothetical protein
MDGGRCVISNLIWFLRFDRFALDAGLVGRFQAVRRAQYRAPAGLAVRRESSHVCVIGAVVSSLQEEDHTWKLRLTGDLPDTRKPPYEAAVAGSGP